jgi:hypothetical protein
MLYDFILRFIISYEVARFAIVITVTILLLIAVAIFITKFFL